MVECIGEAASVVVLKFHGFKACLQVLLLEGSDQNFVLLFFSKGGSGAIPPLPHSHLLLQLVLSALKFLGFGLNKYEMLNDISPCPKDVRLIFLNEESCNSLQIPGLSFVPKFFKLSNFVID